MENPIFPIARFARRAEADGRLTRWARLGWRLLLVAVVTFMVLAVLHWTTTPHALVVLPFTVLFQVSLTVGFVISAGVFWLRCAPHAADEQNASTLPWPLSVKEENPEPKEG